MQGRDISRPQVKHGRSMLRPYIPGGVQCDITQNKN